MPVRPRLKLPPEREQRIFRKRHAHELQRNREVAGKTARQYQGRQSR
jgi:hypothetical protein